MTIRSVDSYPLGAKDGLKYLVILAVISNFFATYLIIFKSPPSMSIYKYILLSMHFVSFLIDVSLTHLLAPFPIPETTGTQMTGIIGQWMSSQGILHMLVIVILFQSSFSITVIGFLYREYILVSSTERNIKKYSRYLVITSLGIVTFILLPYAAITVSIPETEARNRLKIADVELFPNASLFYVEQEPELKQGSIIFAWLFYITFLISTMIKCIKKINQFLFEQRHSMSDESIRMHKMLLKALIWQTSIPSILLVSPIVVVLITVIINWFFSLVDSNFQSIFIVISYMEGFYSTAHLISMIYFTTPYKIFCLKIIRMYKEVKTSVVPSVSSFQQ